VAIVLLILVGSGCGGGGGNGARPAELGKAFQSKAVPVCRSALAQKTAQGPFPYPRFNPTRPDLSKLRGIARLETQTVKIYGTWLRRMQALGQPPKGRAAWSDVLTALRSNGRIIADQRAAAQRLDGGTFTKDYYDGTKAQHELERAADAAGLPTCASAAAV
jgi:hypothetical protein